MYPSSPSYCPACSIVVVVIVRFVVLSPNQQFIRFEQSHSPYRKHPVSVPCAMASHLYDPGLCDPGVPRSPDSSCVGTFLLKSFRRKQYDETQFSFPVNLGPLSILIRRGSRTL